MNKWLYISCFLLSLGLISGSGSTVSAQSEASKPKNYWRFSGQLSVWARYTPDSDAQLSLGHRYIPRFNYGIPLKNDKLIDFEASANTLLDVGLHPEEYGYVNALADPYRVWGRYSSNQFELRAGLQKISFGSAMVLRPLMWFDRIDPRDPQQITVGVYGVLGRYYFQNNANIWIWGLIGNENTKGWESIGTDKSVPEFGGRVQLPLSRGEIAGAYHFRMADPNVFPAWPAEQLGPLPEMNTIPESRIGLDLKMDTEVGWWLEGSWTHLHEDLTLIPGTSLNDQTLLNAGIDYTFPVGNGLNVVYEQLLFSVDEQPFALKDPRHLSSASLSYPIGLFDNLSAIALYDWSTNNPTAFLNWQRTFDHFNFYLLAFYTPNAAPVGNQFNTFGGAGGQSMLIFNH